ncbi:thermonuclease family protein [Candidatus Kaiserbacteria bacterium]|nr:thermonuclease family protein [Candidatus Kaiserbacteria bacterium]
MKYALSLIFIFALGCFYFIHDTYTVTRVIDGDTLVVSRYGKEVPVRLIGIDAPEEGYCYAEEGRQTLERMVGESVTLQMDDAQNAYDAYGRILAYVYADDVLLNREMIKGGYAREYTYIVPYSFQEDFQSVESKAQATLQGGWQACEDWLTRQCGEGMLCSL